MKSWHEYEKETEIKLISYVANSLMIVIPTYEI